MGSKRASAALQAQECTTGTQITRPHRRWRGGGRRSPSVRTRSDQGKEARTRLGTASPCANLDLRPRRPVGPGRGRITSGTIRSRHHRHATSRNHKVTLPQPRRREHLSPGHLREHPDDRAGHHGRRSRRPRGSHCRSDRPGLLRLRHRVPHRAHLRARPGSDSDRLGRPGGAGGPARGRPRPAGTSLRWARCGGGPCGVAGPRRADGGLWRHSRHGLRHPDRRRLPRSVHAFTLPAGRPDARRLAPQGRPPLGLARAADLGAPDHVRPQRRGVPLGAPRGAHREAAGARALGMGPGRVCPGARRAHLGACPRRGVVEARGHPGYVASFACRGARGGGMARTNGRRVQPAPPHGAVGPGTPCSVATPAEERRRVARHPGHRRTPPGPGPRRRHYAGGRTRPRAPAGTDPDALRGA